MRKLRTDLKIPYGVSAFKTMKYLATTIFVATAMAFAASVCAADAAFESDSAKLAAMLAEPQKGDRLLWMRQSPFVAECGRLDECRNLAKSLLARIDKEREGADAQRKEVLRRRSIVWRILAASPDSPARLAPTPFSGELQESALSLDGSGQYGEFVDDPTASDGRAIKIFNTHYEWCVMVMMNRIAFEPGVKYRVRARLRCETEGRGQAFSAGVFDEKAWRNVGYTSAGVNQVSSDYKWYDICTFAPNDAEYFWLAPGTFNKNGGKSAIRALWLDKIAFEPVRDQGNSLAIIPAPQKVVRAKGECRTKGAPKFEKVASIPPEGYEISITKDGVTVRSSDDAGAFYAKMTLVQIESVDPKSKVKTYPCVEIVDAPKFKWRGVLLDTARHFLGKSAILRIIDEMSWYKLNVLQIHFTDDDAWTIEIPEFPELVKHGVVKGRSGFVYGEKLQPFYYSTKDIQEIVAYAAARHIKVVPEIEMPAHFGAAVRAYPSMTCKCPGSNVFCIGNPETLRFAEKVLDRVCELFPSDVIHFGGDECTRKFWKVCPVCQAHIKREGLKGVEEIQPWLTRHLVEYLAKKGRRAIGWDEIFLASSWEKWGDFKKAGGDSFNSLLPKTTMGMCWRPWGAGALAANRGYEIVRCPTSYCYFDYRQGLAEDPFPYLGGHVPLDKVYRFDVLEGVEPQARKNVVGGQCCNWSERTLGRVDLEWKLWPRALALSEALWTYPDPKKRDFGEFSKRAAVHRKRLIRSGVNCAPLSSDF